MRRCLRRRRRGGDPGVTIHLTPEQLRIKGDYYDVFSQMFAAGFFKPQGDWCAANHLEYQVHLNHEEMEMELTHSEGSFFRDMRWVEVPGIDAIWHQIWKDTIWIIRGWQARWRMSMASRALLPRALPRTGRRRTWRWRATS